ncbi:MAG: hypothetical protein GEV11_27390 [Streptosporangiales bacterium]|nr:hypothetical protein [Streptosporangiales bacterium]
MQTLHGAIGKKMQEAKGPTPERRKQLEGYARLAAENPTLFAELPAVERSAAAVYAASKTGSAATPDLGADGSDT